MKNLFFILTIVSLLGCGNSEINNSSSVVKKDSLADKKNQNSNSDFLSKYPLVTWMRKNPVEIGCMLETEFSYRDSVFNCDNKNYVNHGDPYVNTVEYYEGVEIPDSLAEKIHPLIKEIDLKFEYGGLQAMNITLKDSILKSDAKRIFNLPFDDTHLPDNVMKITYGENVYSLDKPTNPDYTRWIGIIGFDHQGSGD
jgi:hypothetical protein